MTSKNFNRVLTVVVNKLNKCYFNFTKPENKKSVSIEKSTFLVEHELGLEIDDDNTYFYITIDDKRMYEIDLYNEVKDSNELFNRVQYLLALAYGDVYNGNYDELVEVEEANEETEEQQTSEESITDTIIADDNSSYNIEVLRAKQVLNAKYGNSYRKHLYAIMNPNWHHVSLATLANIDNDMLDEKRRHYMKVYRMTANVINSIYKCNKLTSIDKLRTNLIQTVRTMAKNEKIEWALVQYVKAKIDNCYLVNGLQSSFYSKTYGHNKSRSYTKTFFI